MTLAKLFILGQEIELLWTNMEYYREIRKNGKPSTDIISGLITLCFATGKDTDVILRWMTKENEDDTWQEVDKMEEGKIYFYENGLDYPPTKTYKFKDTHLIYFKEIFNAEGKEPMQTIITISPAIQNYGVNFLKRWNVSWVVPSKRTPYQAIENNEEPKFIEYYFENNEGEKITQEKIQADQKITLVIETENADNETIDLNLNDNKLDYMYDGVVAENDIIKNIIVTGKETRVELTTIKEKH
ncbi:type VI secretion system tube protein TssD [Tenacibaculum finnmarkense]|uniref:Uncharacterized protein n=1 Tax=Tenacibaculum finnmarkense genomovar finnmarkense TaxID=1458503 RepID=A0AAP1RHM6_9FLAO|nr:type VI secretion system tube protein TssD [Tenacibaculum finnmarkense]MBE7653844.1 hypothetical protein [Tenacibaculum finnmarkense genomovar finnmarkense]MBE7696148.1 hypothetical protein [Tenacibaculum finnmarkense genomovar finnmarkense]MCD8428327.1 hypothetical protein [Tenacibaculum finnmarkense genomovar finnmarkense]MCG8732098.1 hypothetical protein [Tenacibaculum finnmarkense]MCG8752826.1 hypothetical protein [Tenacibaculum finnmarkense]